MKTYLTVLRIADYRILWVGALVSLVGDGASWIAMSWLAVTTGGTGSLTILGLCYSGPIVVGGLLAGKIVDRFSRRMLLMADSTVRGVVMLSVPLLALSGLLSMWHLYAVAAIYGLLKILPIGIIPTVIPELVPKRHLSTAIALESIATNAAGLLGPAIGGALIPLIGVNWVLAVDAASYFVFALAVLGMKARLDKPGHSVDGGGSGAGRGAWAPVVTFLRTDRVMLVITIAFTTFNIAMGMLIVAQPWLAHERLPGGATMLGVLVGVLACAEMAGSVLAGLIPPAVRPMLRIGVLQLVSGAGLLFLLGAHPALVLVGQVVCGIPAAVLVVSSQAVRYERTPEALRGRTMTLMRTLMLSALPVGSVIAGPLLGSGQYTAMVLVMVVLAGGPGLLSLLFVRDAVVNARTSEPVGTASPR
ncbi:MFS transporter [Streptomyces sp. NPDC014983]|uniref:MFS transporter n=1 Tax=Streptomyces sp. NPDC014983 TaxID=3364933 RepID=UPI0036FE81A2